MTAISFFDGQVRQGMIFTIRYRSLTGIHSARVYQITKQVRHMTYMARHVTYMARHVTYMARHVTYMTRYLTDSACWLQASSVVSCSSREKDLF